MKEIILAMAFLAQAVSAQDWLNSHPEIWQQLNEEAQSADWRVREAAFHEVRTLGDLKNPEIARFVFDLLRRENEYLDTLSTRKTAPAEAWGDPYYTGLLQVCLDVFKEAPDARRFQVLASGSFNADSRVAQLLGQHAEASVPWLVEQSRTARNPYRRLGATAVLVQWLNTGGAKEPERRAAALSAIEARLEDTSADASSETANLLAHSNVPEACAILQRASIRLNARGAGHLAVGLALKRCGKL